jgi:hypothetical protein
VVVSGGGGRDRGGKERDSEECKEATISSGNGDDRGEGGRGLDSEEERGEVVISGGGGCDRGGW